MHLVYSIGSGHDEFSDIGFFTIGTKVDEKNLQKAINEIYKEIQAVLDKGVSLKELEMAKTKYLAATLFKLDRPEYLAGLISSQWLFDQEIKTPNQIINLVKKISAKDIQDIAKKIFSESPKVNILTKKIQSVEIPTLN